VLNTAGRRLLAAIRRSMTSLEHAMQGVLERELTGEYCVSSLGVLTDHFVLPSLLELRAGHPLLVPRLVTLLSREANRQLADGQIEIAFYYDATTMAGIHCRRIGALANSLYCGKGHPLFGRRKVAAGELAEHEFSVPAVGDRGTPMDSWPVHLSRKIGFQIMMLSTNVEVALSGRFVCVLPDVVADPHVERRELFRLEPDPVPDTEVYAACREEDVGVSLTARVIESVEQRLASAPVARQRPARAKRPKTRTPRRSKN
jgi:DNA-binding transcriptional LysR family regulator